MKIHHIGYLVKDINKSIDSFSKLGFFLCGEITHDELRKSDICFLKNDNLLIELVSPFSKDSIVYGLLKTYKNAPYHICYSSNNIDLDCEYLVNNGYMIIQEKDIAPAIENKFVVFLFNPKIGIIELVED